MKQVVTDSYLVIEVIGGLDVYSEDVYMCSLHGKTLSDFTYNGKVNKKKLEEAIDDELDTLEVIEKINDPYNKV
jgi:hypothetical protein